MIARSLLEQRHARDDLLAGLSALAEPCWLIMLQLLSADRENERSAAAIAKLLKISISTAERYLRLLEERDLVSISTGGASIIASLQPSAARSIDVILGSCIKDSGQR